MKHLKIFENVNTEYWVTIYHGSGKDVYLDMFPDEESAKNHIIMIVNDERETGEWEKDYTEDMIFTDIDSALEWYKDEFTNTSISYEKVRLSEHFDLPEKLQVLKTSRKYNL